MFIDDVSNTMTVDQRKIFECEGLFHIFYHTGSSSSCLNIRFLSVVPTTTRCIHPKPRTDHVHFLLQESQWFLLNGVWTPQSGIFSLLTILLFSDLWPRLGTVKYTSCFPLLLLSNTLPVFLPHLGRRLCLERLLLTSSLYKTSTHPL